MADDEKEPIYCYRCKSTNYEGDKYCVHCGAPLVNRCMDEAGKLDKGCGAKNEPHAAFCVKCGHKTLFHHHGLVNPHPAHFGGSTANGSQIPFLGQNGGNQGSGLF